MVIQSTEKPLLQKIPSLTHFTQETPHLYRNTWPLVYCKAKQRTKSDNSKNPLNKNTTKLEAISFSWACNAAIYVTGTHNTDTSQGKVVPFHTK